jgi:hypothetical protein
MEISLIVGSVNPTVIISAKNCGIVIFYYYYSGDFGISFLLSKIRIRSVKRSLSLNTGNVFYH